jgi:hypothetical protein
MLRSLVAVLLGLFLIDSGVAVAAGLPTVEKWLCSRDGLSRTVRLVAVTPGQAPCKIFYAKRVASDPNDVAEEVLQDTGEVHPIFYSDHSGSFCVRKLKEFIEDKKEHVWTCSKI